MVGTDRELVKNNFRTTEDAVMNVPQPEFTNTWRPYAHNIIIEGLTRVTREMGLTVVHKQYSLNEKGTQMYGAWGIDTDMKKGSEGHHIYQAIIFRNSIDKAFSFGIAGGTDTWVCENLAVWGNFIEIRKHSSSLDRTELVSAMFKGIKSLKPELDKVIEWHDLMREIRLDTKTVEALAYQAIMQGVINLKKLPVFHRLLFGEDHPYDNTTLFGFHGACTEVLRDGQINSTMIERQEKLNTLIKMECPALHEVYGPNDI